METPPNSTAITTTSRRRIGRHRRSLVALVATAPVLLTGCTVPSFWAPKGATTQAQETYKLWQEFMVVGLIVGGFTLGLIIWAALRYRARDASIPKQTQYHIPVEILYTVIPTILVAGLFWITIVAENKVTAMPVATPTVQVNAFQWGWKFSYPGHPNATVVGQTTENPTLVLPEGVPSKIVLTSSDVVHGFYVNAFDFSRYALPGVINTFTLTPTKTGVFPGQCTQLCGLYHSIMYFKVKVVSPAAFKTWLNTAGQSNVLAMSNGASK
ncbi:MAG: cytochrome c oxidase subunit II [Actinobacteria bacterium]|nr:cytochrome c oxidase subunit II [Actinomycetota bacterium]